MVKSIIRILHKLIRKEQWKPIEGASRYQISNFGRVKSLERWTPIGKKGTMRFRPESIMVGCDFGHEYLKVNLTYDNGKVKNRKIHRLVLEAFVPNPHKKRCVNHMDFNRCNNHIDNLQWATHKENNDHTKKFGRHRNKQTGKLKK